MKASQFARSIFILSFLALSPLVAIAQVMCDTALRASTDSSLMNLKQELLALINEYHKTTDPIGRSLLQKNIDIVIAKLKQYDPQFQISKLPLTTSQQTLSLSETNQRKEESKFLNLPSEFREIKSELRLREELADANPNLQHEVILLAKQDLGSSRNHLTFINTREYNFIELKHPQSKWLPLISKKKFFINIRENEHHTKDLLLQLINFNFSQPSETRFFVTKTRQHILVADGPSIKIYSIDSINQKIDGNLPLHEISLTTELSNKPLESLALSDDLKYLVYYSEGRLNLLDVKNQTSTQRKFLDAPLVKFSPDNQWLVVFANGHTRIFDLQRENFESNAFYFNFSHMGQFDQHILWTSNNRYVAVIAPGAIKSFSFFVFDTHTRKEIEFDTHPKLNDKESTSLSARWNPKEDALSIVTTNQFGTDFFMFKPSTSGVFSAPIGDIKVKNLTWISPTEFKIFGAQHTNGSGLGAVKFFEIK